MMTAIVARSARPVTLDTDLAVYFAPDRKPDFRQLMRQIELDHGHCEVPVRAARFTGKLQETLLLHPTKGKTRQVLLVGIGDPAALTLERIRRVGGTSVRTALGMKVSDVSLVWSPEMITRDTLQDAAQALAEGVLLSTYRYSAYKTVKAETTSRLRRVLVLSHAGSDLTQIRNGIQRARILSASVFLARDLENAPGNEVYPDTLARKAAQSLRRTGVRVTILGPPQLRRLGMGGLLGVAAGSARPPRFIILEYRGTRRSPVVLVGKGVTFDSGGISIKPSANMAEMKMDMSGAAAVIGTLQAAAQLRLPVHLVGLIPATENLPGGKALKPGDILTHLNGMTSEVDNTDAEGRLILADALAYSSRFSPDLVIDVATLTGAVVVALGHVTTGMMGNDQDAMNALTTAGEKTYERVWQFPLFEEYERLLKSDVADVKNVGGRWAGAITAALFLRKFVGDQKWVHLDIAGTAIMEEAFEYIPKGGSGVGVRLLIEFLTTRSRR